MAEAVQAIGSPKARAPFSEYTTFLHTTEEFRCLHKIGGTGIVNFLCSKHAYYMMLLESCYCLLALLFELNSLSLSVVNLFSIEDLLGVSKYSLQCSVVCKKVVYQEAAYLTQERVTLIGE
jgi:hypothetical protein